MILQSIIQALAITLLSAILAAFIAVQRLSAPFRTFLATVSWNG